MKLHSHSILPFCFVLGGGMAIGNVHSAMSRGVIPSPMGYIFMSITFLSILAGLTLSRYYEGLPSVGYWGAFGCAVYVMVFGIVDIASSLSQKPSHHERPEPVIGLAISCRFTLDFRRHAKIQ